MKTQILQLDSHDDVVSTRDKMGWGKTGRILLVWPRRGRILTRQLDLVLLLRHSNMQGTQLALVTADADVRFHAEELKIPVFKTLREAQGKAWRGGRKYKPRIQPLRPRPDFIALREELHPSKSNWLDHPASRWGVFSLSILSLLALLAVILPGATVSIDPKNMTQEIVFTLVADPSIQRMNLSGEIPLHPVNVVIEGRDTISTTSATMIPEKSAIGTVRFTNQTEKGIDIPKGLIVTNLATPESQPVQFEITGGGSVPAGIGESASLPVRAILPGSEGNLPPDSIVAIQGPLGLSLFVTNPKDTYGGTSLLVPSPGPEDYTQLYNKLSASLQKTALTEILSGLGPGDFAITPTITLSQTLVEIYTPPLLPAEGSLPADQLDLKLRQVYRMMVVSEEDLQSLAIGVLDANQPAETLVSPETLSIEHLGSPRTKNGSKYEWKVRARRLLQADIAQTRVQNLIRGLSPGRAVEELANQLPLDIPPQITTLPDWWPRLPVLPLRIRVTYR